MPISEKLDPVHLAKNSDDFVKVKPISSAETTVSFSKLSIKQWGEVGMLACVSFLSTVNYSSISPFFPGEAQKKNLSTTEIGIIFGIFELAMLIVSPLFGKYLYLFGAKKFFSFGLLFTGVTSIAFGFLNLLPSGRIFFWTSLGIRCAGAVGDAAFVTSSFVISVRSFPGRIATIIGIMETFSGLGYTVGPVIGGALYEYGGYQLPFFVVGALLILTTMFSLFLIESSDEDPNESDDKNGMLEILKIPAIWIMVFGVVICATSFHFFDPTLANHLASFNFSTTVVGLMFLLSEGIYTASAPIVGIMIDRWQCSNTTMVFGSIGTMISMLLIGPSPLLHFEKNLVLIILSLTLLGVAVAAFFIPSYNNCLDAVKEYSYENSLKTNGYISGIVHSAYAFGSFVGLTLGSIGVEIIGFGWTTTAIGIINIIFILILKIFLTTKSKASQRSSKVHDVSKDNNI